MTYKEVEAIRKKLGLTRVGFAERLGVSIHAYYSWSRTGREVKGAVLVLLKEMERKANE